MRNGEFPVLRRFCYTLGAAAAAAAIATGGLAVAGAATNACAQACMDIGFVSPGFGRAILASRSGLDTTGNLVRLLPASNGRPDEDFDAIAIGTFVPTYCTKGGQAVPGSLFTSRQCHLLVGEGFSKDQTYELAFNPGNGGPQDECVGATGPKPGDKVRLEPCGVSAATVLIPVRRLPGGQVSFRDASWVVNGASDNFSNPNVLTSNGTYPSNLTWAPVTYNGGRGIGTQEVCGINGPYRGPVCARTRIVKGTGPAHR